MAKRILIVDDHDVVRHGVRLILRNHSEWSVVGEAEDGTEAIDKIKALDPDLTILDISMPRKDGLEVIGDLTHLKVRSKILVLTMHESKELLAAIRGSIASGYVLKNHASRDLARAVAEILDGGTFFPEEPPAPKKPILDKKVSKPGIFRLRWAPSYIP